MEGNGNLGRNEECTFRTSFVGPVTDRDVLWQRGTSYGVSDAIQRVCFGNLHGRVGSHRPRFLDNSEPAS